MREEHVTTWPAKRLGDLGEVKMGRQSSPKYRQGLGVRPYLRVVNVFDDRLDLRDVKEMDFAGSEFEKYRLMVGDVLLTEGDLVSAANVGRSAIFRGEISECCFQNTLLRFRAGPEIASEFAHYAFCYLRLKGAFALLANGTTVFHLGSERLKELQVPLPPLPEQRKIAAILSSVDEAIEKSTAVIDQLEIVKKALMQELLTRGLPGRHTRFKQTEIGEIPEGWEVLSYGELAATVPQAIQSGPFGSALRHSEFTETGKLVVGIDNVLDGRFSLGSSNRISDEKFRDLQKFEARPLDLLITVMATVGRCCVVPKDIEPAIITKHVYRLSPNLEIVNSYFLMYCVYGVPAVTGAIRGNAQGLSRPGLNKSLLLPIQFPVPPLEEQERIVGILQALDARVDATHRYVARTKELKASLLSALLSGEVRVPLEQEAA